MLSSVVDLEMFPAAAECALNDEWRHGVWHGESHVWLIEPVERYTIIDDQSFLQVGRPGVDGIGFGYRAGMVGFWAYYPQESRFELLASSVSDFVRGWLGGAISV